MRTVFSSARLYARTAAPNHALKKAPPHCAAGQLSSYRTIIATALDQAVSFGVSASRRRVSPELRAPLVV